MPSGISQVLFSEPSGRRQAIVMFAGTFVFSSLYAYNVVRGDASSANWLPFMIGGTALSGIAESLPEHRRRAAGILRVTAILLLLCLVVTIVVAPEFIVGPR
ncbi:hypothetical protein [Halorarum halobium]|uniref:hypothetical protein n=1 Tax=Halorarum halobium TaxID=3075121 RepID=UPI0028A7AA6F|nr:hypothetical protein [Halobaculum sp. XH14]